MEGRVNLRDFLECELEIYGLKGLYTQSQSLGQYTFKIFCPRLASVGLVNVRPIHASGSRSEQTTAVTGHPKTFPGRPIIILLRHPATRITP